MVEIKKIITMILLCAILLQIYYNLQVVERYKFEKIVRD